MWASEQGKGVRKHILGRSGRGQWEDASEVWKVGFGLPGQDLE
jgi:hypothetical protein